MNTNALRHKRDLVALEAHSTTNLVALLKNSVPAMITDFKGFIGFFDSEAPAVTMTTKQKDFVALINKHHYTDIVPLLAYTPEGLDMTYLEYAEVLQLATNHARKVYDDVLGRYSGFLSMLISNNSEISSGASMHVFFDGLATARTDANAALGDCFEKGSVRAESKIGNVINRNSDWPKVFNMADLLGKEINSVNRPQLSKKMRECASLLDIITAKIRRGEFENVSPQVVMNLSNGAYQVACELEFYAVTHYKVQALTGAIDNTVRHVTQVLTK